jgi:hypothetical protein
VKLTPWLFKQEMNADSDLALGFVVAPSEAEAELDLLDDAELLGPPHAEVIKATQTATVIMAASRAKR